MIALVALSGWILAALGCAAALAERWTLGRRMESVARACHELRGPLSAARLGLGLGSRVGELSAARVRAIDLELARAALVLDDLNGDVRSSSRERVDIEQLLVDSVEAWRASAAARDVALTLEWYGGARVYVAGERLRLAQAMGNLIANAIEHGGGEVAVRARVDHRAVRIEVVDGGPGLPGPVAELARRPRAGRGRRGRGLAIAGAVAETHGGRLAAAPSERGARLVLELPVSGGAPAQAPAAG